MSSRIRVRFANPDGQSLAATLSVPTSQPLAYVLFAHCFTCGKDIRAAARIAQALAAGGYAVMRFDFTGLGESEGDFAETSFSSNVADLIAAADYLRAEHQAPAVLIGHSLGGTGVLAAAGQIPECKAVVTIGSPATPAHLMTHADSSHSAVDGAVTIQLAGRELRLSQEFVEDLQQDQVTERVAQLRRALLVMHAPFDNIVSIDQASLIFQAAKHPKSFVTLDGADHLLSRTQDAEYTAGVIAAWLKRYLPGTAAETDRPDPVPGGRVRVEEANKAFLRQIVTDDHAWVADEPLRVGGDNLGPDPYEHLLAALGACTSMTIRMYANHKGLPLEDVNVELTHSREHLQDCEQCEEKDQRIEVLHRTISFAGDLTDAQIERLMQIADRCPVHRTLEGQLRITTALVDG